MDEVIPQTQLRWTVMASACLHAGVALFLLMRMGAQEHVVPVGIEMLYLGEAKRSAPVTRVISPRAPSLPKAIHEPAEIQRDRIDESPLPQEAASAGPAGARDGAVVSAMERYKFELRLYLESRKVYPETAKRLRQAGNVVVSFKVDTEGVLSDVKLEQASASEILNRAAVDLVKSAARFKPLPSDARLAEIQLSLPIEYSLL